MPRECYCGAAEGQPHAADCPYPLYPLCKKEEHGDWMEARQEKRAAASPAPPLEEQCREAKERHPGMLLLFRVGDFYEAFGEDAVTLKVACGSPITLRKGASGEQAMAGFPHHALEARLRELLRAGHRVAVCDRVK